MNEHNDYCDNMFSIPLLHIEVRNWDNKKEQLKNICDRCDFNTYTNTKIETDYHNQKEIYVKDIRNILNEELDIFVNHFDFKTCNILNAWFEKASKQNFHEIHNHGCYGYSGVCYVEYHQDEHMPTKFISPFNSFLHGTILTYVPTVKEGSLILFPSVLNHYTLPNESEKERLILSFNLNVS